MEPLVSATGITSASAFPALSVASATMLVVVVAVPELLIVAPVKDTPLGTVPCRDQVTLVGVRLMTLVPSVAARVPPPNVPCDTAVAISAVSCHVWAVAGSAAAPTARAPPSSPGTTIIPSALLSLKCKASPRSVSLSLGRCQTIWQGAQPTGRSAVGSPASQMVNARHSLPPPLRYVGRFRFVYV